MLAFVRALSEKCKHIFLRMLAIVFDAKHNRKLPLTKRTQALAMLCEGSSMRSISRVADVSINSVSKLLVEAGEACLAITVPLP